MDLVLWATRGLWTCVELVDYIRRAKEELEFFIPQVMQVVQGHLQWTDARHSWLQAVVHGQYLAEGNTLVGCWSPQSNSWMEDLDDAIVAGVDIGT